MRMILKTRPCEIATSYGISTPTGISLVFDEKISTVRRSERVGVAARRAGIELCDWIQKEVSSIPAQ